MTTEKRINLAYQGLQGMYWMICCLVGGFASVFLLANGYSNSEIGIILAAGSSLALIMQPLTAEISDRSKKLTMFEMIFTFLILVLSMSIGLYFIKPNSVGMTVFFVLFLCGSTTLQPLVNSLAFYLEKVNISIHFGVARGIGSFTYAVLSAIMGTVVNKVGEKSILVVCLMIAILAMLMLFIVKRLFKRESNRLEQPEYKKELFSVSENIEKLENGGSFIFQRRNRRYLYLIFATFFLFYGLYFANNFLIQIVKNVGGNVSNMGILVFYTAMVELPAMFLFDRFYGRIKCNRMLQISSVFFAVKIGGLLISSSVPMLFIAMTFQAGSFALFTPASLRYVNDLLGIRNGIRGQAYLAVMNTASGILASLSGGVLIDHIGISGALLVSTASSVFGMIIMIFGLRHKE